ncbi:MAG: hypothetical protein PHG55_10450 [Verrucomicrobiota bacterium]|nr:hypothetical protein [Verrucomicrobiota bacterium]
MLISLRHCVLDDGKVHATWGATYPVAYDYDAWGRMIAMATTRDPAYANQNLWNLLGYDLFLIDTDDPDYPSDLDTTLWIYDLSTGLMTGKTYADGQVLAANGNCTTSAIGKCTTPKAVLL